MLRYYKNTAMVTRSSYNDLTFCNTIVIVHESTVSCLGYQYFAQQLTTT